MAYVLQAAGNQVPGAGQAGVQVRAQDNDALVAPVRLFPQVKQDQQRLGLGAPGDRASEIEFALVYGECDLEVLEALGDGPEVRARVPDDIGRAVGEAEEEPDLHRDQGHREDDPDQSDDKAGAVMGEIAPGE